MPRGSSLLDVAGGKPDMHGADEVSYETLTGWVKERDKLIAEDAAGKR